MKDWREINDLDELKEWIDRCVVHTILEEDVARAIEKSLGEEYRCRLGGSALADIADEAVRLCEPGDDISWRFAISEACRHCDDVLEDNLKSYLEDRDLFCCDVEMIPCEHLASRFPHVIPVFDTCKLLSLVSVEGTELITINTEDVKLVQIDRFPKYDGDGDLVEKPIVVVDYDYENS